MKCWFLFWVILAVQQSCGMSDISNSSLPYGRDTVTERVNCGHLIKWSKQRISCSKKVIFIHGRFMGEGPDSVGQTQATVEQTFACMLDQLQWVCKEKFNQPLSELAEIWFYTYNTNQKIDLIATDLVSDIKSSEEFGDATICLVGHSEGGLVTWVIDQQYQVIAGGVLLGAPVLGSPLADYELLDRTARKLLTNTVTDALHQLIDYLIGGSENLVSGYPGTGSAKSKLISFAGRISLPSVPNAWPHVADMIMGILDDYKRGYGIQDSNRQSAEVGAIFINASDWRNGDPLEKQSDGIVPVYSAIYGCSHYQIWDGYDHADLLSGKDDLILSRAVFNWIDYVLDLSFKGVFMEDLEIPHLPEIEINLISPLTYTKFVYIQDGKIRLANKNWENFQTISVPGTSSYPRFDNTGSRLVWTQIINGFSDIYLLDGISAKSITCDGVSKFADFSPNGKWLTYQSSSQLVIYHLGDKKQEVVLDGVDLISSPLWITTHLQGRIYFASRDANGQANLYWISPRQRNSQLTNAKSVINNCGVPFWVQGSLGGVLGIQDSTDVDGISIQTIWIISNALSSRFSVEMRYGENQSISGSGDGIQMELSEYFGFTSAVLDIEAQQLYLVSETKRDPGIYILDIGSFVLEAEPEFEAIFHLVVESASELDINPAG